MNINHTIQEPGFITLQANDQVITQLYKYQDMSEKEVRDAYAQEELKEEQYGATASDETKAAFDAAFAKTAAAAEYDEYFPDQKKVILPFVTVRANMDTEEMVAYKINNYERYGDSFTDFCGRAKGGRKTEQLVYYWLTQAGVVANLETMVLDGDTSTKAPDITVRAAEPDDNGDYQWYSLEVKTTTLDYEEYSRLPA